MSKSIEIGSIVCFQNSEGDRVEGVVAHLFDDTEIREAFLLCLEEYPYSRCSVEGTPYGPKCIVYSTDDNAYKLLSCVPCEAVTVVESLQGKADQAIKIVRDSDVLEVHVEEDPEGVSIVTFFLDRDSVERATP